MSDGGAGEYGQQHPECEVREKFSQ
jgi:hypothetical protein